jgi:hypothetical protein
MLPESRLPMRRTREILRLHFESELPPRQIASICKVAKSTVQRYLERLKAAGLSWPLPSDLDDLALERRLFPPPPVAPPETTQPAAEQQRQDGMIAIANHPLPIGNGEQFFGLGAVQPVAQARSLLAHIGDVDD